MFKKLILVFIFFIPLVNFSQDYSALWDEHFSYLNIKDVTQNQNKLYAASENAIFVYDTETQEIETLTTVNGLSGEAISQIHYSEAYELLVVGYENGLMDIVFDNDDDVLTVIDILEKPTIPPGSKIINHFNEHLGFLYIATDYGISVYDLSRLEFGDTYFIGNGGAQIRVTQTTVFNGFIYASCLDANGLKRALVTSDDLIDYQEWETFRGGNYRAVQAMQEKLFLSRADRSFFEIIDNAMNLLVRYDDLPLDVRATENYLVVTTVNNVFVYDINFTLISQISVSDPFITDFTSATVVAENVYIGTKDFGVLNVSLNAPTEFQELHPNGPLMNTSFSIEASPNNLWMVYGDYSLTYNPAPLRTYGFSHLNENEWVNVPYADVLAARNLCEIAINPFSTSQVFMSSFHEGLLEVNDDLPTILYNQDNSGLESLVIPTSPNYVSIRTGASIFDTSGVLWTMTARVERPLKSYDPSTGEWNGYNFTSLIADPLEDEWGYSDIDIDNNNTKWIGGYNYGLIAFNNNGGNQQLASIKDLENNMPSNYVTSVAVDKQNQVWVGTTGGLRVLYNTGSIFTDDNASVQEIIILEDGVPKELLFRTFVTDIEVDGSNNKWISTVGSGVFYFSADAQLTLYHFTKENSPLPSNNVVDVALDGSNGRVYFATDKGLVSFKAGGSETQTSIENAYVYPNPVRPTFNIVGEKVKIKGISDNINIKITDIEGNLVAEAQSKVNLRYKGYNLEIDGGTAFWNGKNLSNNVVASGVYLIMLYDLDSFETKVLKVMVVR